MVCYNDSVAATRYKKTFFSMSGKGVRTVSNFLQISLALKYIDEHLEESINLEMLSEKFCISPYYFHRLFSVIVGKSLAVYIRDRRILHACLQLSGTEKTILDIALDNGFHSAQSFSRTFKASQGLSPSEYRKQGYRPVIVTADELIRKFTNRLRGGTYLNPKIIKRDAILIAGTVGSGRKTGEVWKAFMKLYDEKPLHNALDDNRYEVRIYDGDKDVVYVGIAVSGKDVDEAYTTFELPQAMYASFDVYVAKGYGSENSAMEEWLETNEDGYCQKLLDGNDYCVEFYDERFNGNETDSIVEIWMPIQRTDAK